MLLEELKKLKKKYNVESKTNKKDIANTLIEVRGAAMNITDVILTGGAILTWWAIPFMLFAGFITPLPYNYYRLKKFNQSCH